jgi:hypothetical protein
LTRTKRKYTRKAVKAESSAEYAESGSDIAENGLRVAECGESALNYGKVTRVNKPGAGRPQVYSDDVWKSIFDRVGGGASLTTALKETGLSYTHAYRLMDADPRLAEGYERAKKDRASRMAEEIIELADAPIPEHLQGVEISAWVNQKRLQVDARKWVAAKLHPKVYGDKIDVSVRDERISVLDALEAARSRVQIGMDVTDITPKLSTDQR